MKSKKTSFKYQFSRIGINVLTQKHNKEWENQRRGILRSLGSPPSIPNWIHQDWQRQSRSQLSVCYAYSPPPPFSWGGEFTLFMKIFVSMPHVFLHVHTACPCCMSLPHVLASCPCCMSMLHVCDECPCRTSMLNVHTTCPCHMSMPHVHATCPCRMSMLHVWPPVKSTV